MYRDPPKGSWYSYTIPILLFIIILMGMFCPAATAAEYIHEDTYMDIFVCTDGDCGWYEVGPMTLEKCLDLQDDLINDPELGEIKAVECEIGKQII